jgi:hypothetical protein
MYNVLSQVVTQSPPPVIANRQSHPDLFSTTLSTNSLSADQQIASLKWELYQLCNLHPRVGERKEKDTNVDIAEDEPKKRNPAMRPEVVIPKKKPVDKHAES